MLTHKLKTKNIGGWSGYIQEHSKTGPVLPREPVAFLILWLECFMFYGSTLGPTTNMQAIVEALADRQPVAVGRLLMGATYELLHKLSRQLSRGESVGHYGGPWWFIQY